MKETESFHKNQGDIKKLIESRITRFGKIEPSLDEIELMRMEKKSAVVAGQSNNDSIVSMDGFAERGSSNNFNS